MWENATTIIATVATTLAAIILIVSTYRKIGKWISLKIAKASINELKEPDIDPESYVGHAFAFDRVVVDELKSIHASILNSRKSTLRIELLQLIHNTPEKTEIIEQLFDEYRSIGGNSYMIQVIKEYRTQYGREVIKKRIEKPR